MYSSDVSGIKNSVLNRKRNIQFGSLQNAGWFSAAPDDTSVNRAIRTNNPGALNLTTWQRKRPGYVGHTEPDSAGNITTIYQTPESGIAAWYHLVSEIYGFGELGQFDLTSLARRYAGRNASERAVKAYTDGWARWSGGVLDASSVVHLSSNPEMLQFATALFAHEAASQTPLHDDQIIYAIDGERSSIAGSDHRLRALRTPSQIYNAISSAAGEGILEQVYEEGIDEIITHFGERILEKCSKADAVLWLRLFASISNISVEGPSDITLLLYEKQRDLFDGALKELTPYELFAIEDFISAVQDPGLTIRQMEAATVAAKSAGESDLVTKSLPVLAKLKINQEISDRRVIRYTGVLTVWDTQGNVVGSFNATTGGFVASYRRQYGPTPPGYFVVSHYRSRTERWATREGVGFTFDLDEVVRTGNRSAFRIHPDGPPPGTHGCVGLTENSAGLLDCSRKLRANLADVQEFRLLVEYGNG